MLVYKCLGKSLMRCGRAMWARFNKELISKQMKRRVGGGLDTFYDNRRAPSTISP